MKVFKEMRTFLLEDQFKINYQNNKIDILNYTNIAHFDTSKMIIHYDEGNITITGSNLIVTKLLMDELLITGNIEKIEFR